MIDNTLQRLKEQYIRLYEKEKLKGGLADGKSLEDIAKHHKVDIEVLKKQWNMGMDVEKEHTDDNLKADEIVKDHLWEDPEYYTRLSKMEEGWKFVITTKDGKIKLADMNGDLVTRDGEHFDMDDIERIKAVYNNEV
jgi:hypothetical protein